MENSNNRFRLSDSGYRSVYFNNSDTGYVNYNGGEILKTTDGGKDWIIQYIPLNNTYSAGAQNIYFADINTGYAATYEGIIKTTNGGNEWKLIYPSGAYWQSIFFTDGMTGYAALDNNIFKTTDGGESWIAQNSGIGEPLSSIYFPVKDTGYAVGLNGTIIKTTDGGGTYTSVPELGIRNEELRIKVYPNPADQIIAISYQLSAKSLVVLKIYDMVGNEVSKLLNKEQEKGDYKIEFNAEKLNNGIYFCGLQAGNSSITGKLVVVH